MASTGSLGRHWLRLLGALIALAVLGFHGTALAYDVYPAQAGQGSITDDSTCNLSDALDSVKQGTPLHGCEGPNVSSITLYATTKSVTSAAQDQPRRGSGELHGLWPDRQKLR